MTNSKIERSCQEEISKTEKAGQMEVKKNITGKNRNINKVQLKEIFYVNFPTVRDWENRYIGNIIIVFINIKSLQKANSFVQIEIPILMSSIMNQMQI